MIARRIHNHFFPHFLVDFDSAKNITDPHKVHHRAHAVSLFALIVYFNALVLTAAALYTIRLHAPQILGTVSFSADQIITLSNQKRSQNGISPVTFNSLLAAAAQAKAQNMFKEDYWAHNSPSGKPPWAFITAAGYHYVFAGENLARDFDDPGAVVNAWMNSPSHRSNLLDKNFKEIGVAVASGKIGGREGSLVIQMFGTSVASVQKTTAAPSSPKPPSSPKSQAVSGQVTEATPQALVQKTEEITTSEVTAPIEEVAVLSGRQFSIAKAVTLAIIGFIFSLFAFEVLITLRRESVPVRSGIIAHLMLLAFVLLAVWYAVSGAII